jgi:RNA polymerase sigma-70 factor, ECF subfamily
VPGLGNRHRELLRAPGDEGENHNEGSCRTKVSVDWGDVYRSTFEELVRFLHRKVWDLERARDLAQEAFVRALRSEPHQPRAWLFRVAANLARDEARSVLRRKKHLALLRTEADEGRQAPGPDEAVLEEEEWDQMRRALDALTERDREVLLLWSAGLSYREMADVTDLASGAIGTTLARARRRLVEAHGEMEKERAAHH